METVYLDNAATTKPVSSIMEAIKPYIETNWYNPSVLYSKGKDVKEKIEEIRSYVATEIGAWSDEIYFTSGASESNNWVIHGFIDECKANWIQPVIITTHIEHKSVEECIKNLLCIESDLECEYLSVNNYGQVKINELEELLEYFRIADDDTNRIKVLVSIGMANSEIGTIQDINNISNIVHRYNAIIHTDATQSFGHIPIDVNILDVDLLTASAQKLGGLKGTGFLYKRRGINIKPLIYGSQENGQRGGTENVVGIVALGEAVKQIDYFKTDNVKHLKNYMIEKLVNRLGCKVNGSIVDRLPNNINITFPQSITGEALIYMLDMCNIYISSGSACNTHSIKPSYVLQAIGLDDYEISRTIRITLPDDINKEQIDTVVDEIEKQIQVLTL